MNCSRKTYDQHLRLGASIPLGLFEVGLINPTLIPKNTGVLLLDMRLSNTAYLLESE